MTGMSLTGLMAALLFAVAAAVGGYAFGTRQANVACTATTQTAAAGAAGNAITQITQSRNTERTQQEVVNAALRTQARDINSTRAALDVALGRLRQRSNRAVVALIPGLPAAAQPACAGNTGAELSRPDAEFLSREAARADEQRAALSACYAAVDAGQAAGPIKP